MPARSTIVRALVLATLLPAASASADVPALFESLFAEARSTLAERHFDGYLEFCLEFELNCNSPRNQRTFSEVVFYHDLLTGTGAVDCRAGGILGIPYFWHWIDPNPRHSIVALPDSIPLTEIEPPAGFERYKSLADVDRVPTIFLSDLVSETPRYRHAGCGEFFTFGWCSEREMAFVALMVSRGHEGRIVQQGIHVWSELLCSFAGEGGGTVHVVANVDNTYDTLDWSSLPAPVSTEEWLADVGTGTEVDWYNAVARSESEREALRDTPVPEAAVSRIRGLMREALDGRL